jgi:hypothetical protein
MGLNSWPDNIKKISRLPDQFDLNTNSKRVGAWPFGARGLDRQGTHGQPGISIRKIRLGSLHKRFANLRLPLACSLGVAAARPKRGCFFRRKLPHAPQGGRKQTRVKREANSVAHMNSTPSTAKSFTFIELRPAAKERKDLAVSVTPSGRLSVRLAV